MDLTKNEIRTAQAAAASLQRTYGIDMHDIQQEMLVWMLNHEAKVIEFRKKPGLYITLIRLGVRYCKKEWKHTNGGPAPDQYSYSRKALRRLLPMAMHSDLGQLASGGISEGPSAGGDPALGGNLQVELMDVRTALKALPANQSEALIRAAEVDFDAHVLGEEILTDMSEPIGAEAARARINYYLDNMRKVLNGDLPPGAGYGADVESDEDAEAFYRRQLKGFEEWTGHRPSSSEAQQRFRADYEGVPDGYLSSLYYDSYGASWDGVE